MTQLIDTVELAGGVDEVSIPVAMQPGMLIACRNFEPGINGGYKRIAGYERFDGRPSPHKAVYEILTVDLIGTPAIGDVVEGATSGATATVIQVNTDTVVVTKVTGEFEEGEDLEISTVVIGSVVLPFGQASDARGHAILTALAADNYRADILAVPGSGPVRGVWEYLDNVYAFRDNVAGTACVMHVATASGWSAITPGFELAFSNAVGEIFEGDTVTGATSGASGVVQRALLRTGTWSTSGVGTLVFDSIAGTFQNGEDLQVSGVTKAEADGTQSQIALLPGGKFDFDNYNFTGATSTYRMYFADGVNRLHEFDGTRLVPIPTGALNDKPSYVRAFRSHLTCVLESSLQISATGDPYNWSAVNGAAEIALGEVGTGLLVQVGDSENNVLIVSTTTKIYVLYGHNTGDFHLVTHSPEVGAIPWTLQNLGEAFFMQPRGITQLRSSDTFGGFDAPLLSRAIQPTIDRLSNQQTASYVVRNANQYRVMFSDGSMIIMQLPSGRRAPPLTYCLYPDVMSTVVSSILSDGTERIFAGSENGFVYELDVGTSFDGGPLECALFTTFAHSKSPRTRKRYRRAQLHLAAGVTASMNIGYNLSWGDRRIGNPELKFEDGGGGGGFWGLFVWDTIIWDAGYSQKIDLDIPGVGESLALLLTSNNTIDQSFTLNTLFIHYLPGRQAR